MISSMRLVSVVTILLLGVTEIQAKLLDKIVAVFNDKTISLSQVERTHDNMVARVNISPQIYQEDTYTNKEIIDKMIERLLIRERLSEMGYIVTDEQVESQIRATENRLGLSRNDLLQFLEANQTTFDEYFEIIRETIEFNIFNSRIIEPLINITEQEIKNAYYNQYADSRTVSFNYHLIGFSMSKEQMTNSMVDEFPEVLRVMQERGTLPDKFRSVSSSDLGRITEDGMSDAIREAVSKADEGEFSRPVLIGADYHVFYIRERDLIESTHFRRARQNIHEQLYLQAFGNISALWYRRQANRHFIKINL